MNEEVSRERGHKILLVFFTDVLRIIRKLACGFLQGNKGVI